MINGNKILGVIGGVGPMATAYFMELVINMTEACTDQEHLNMIIYNYPIIPDRTEHMLGRSDESPLPYMTDIAGRLEAQGADYLAVPCCTAHYYFDALQKSVKTPIINILTVTAEYLKEHGIKRAGIMGTTGTLSTGIFQKQLEMFGIESVLPSEKSRKDLMHIIYDNVKAGKPVETDTFSSVSEELKGNGAEVNILGCTELSVIKRDYKIGAGFIDTMDVLAQRSVILCGKKLKEEYRELITK